MKPTMALVAALGLTSVPSAADVDRPYAPQARTTQPANVDTADEMDEAERDAWRATTYPFRMIGRGGMTVLRSPMIVGETLTGDRKFISKDGLFMRVDEVEEVDTRRDAPARSIPMGRGQRTPLGPR